MFLLLTEDVAFAYYKLFSDPLLPLPLFSFAGKLCEETKIYDVHRRELFGLYSHIFKSKYTIQVEIETVFLYNPLILDVNLVYDLYISC